MRSSYYTLKDRKPVVCTMIQWAEEIGDGARIVARNGLGKVRVSTVFLGMDHNHSGTGAPILFETMIFGGPLDQEMWRYSTWDEAVAGHQIALEKVKSNG